jgi:hypothetical protein
MAYDQTSCQIRTLGSFPHSGKLGSKLTISNWRCLRLSTLKRMGKWKESTKCWNIICRIIAISRRIIGVRCYQWQSKPIITLLPPLREGHWSLQTLGSILEWTGPFKWKQIFWHLGPTFTGWPACMHCAIKAQSKYWGQWVDSMIGLLNSLWSIRSVIWLCSMGSNSKLEDHLSN